MPIVPILPRFLLRQVCWSLCLLMLSGAAFADDARFAPTAPGSFRFMTWNVSRESFVQHEQSFARIVRALDPDILVLDELPAEVSQRSLARWLADIEQRKVADREAILGIGGGHYQRVAVISRFPMQRLAVFDALRYSASDAAPWLKQVGSRADEMQANLDLGLPTSGVRIKAQGRPLIVVGVDLQCCGNSTAAWEEKRRIVEAGMIRDAIEQIRQPEDAVLIAGDFNNVQGMAPLHVLLDMGKPHALSAVPAIQLDGQQQWTWDGEGTPFPSARLDHVLVSDTLQIAKSWIFDTRDLDPKQLAELDLERRDSRKASDHLPIVVDFRWVDSEGR